MMKQNLSPVEISILDESDIFYSRQEAKIFAEKLGFSKVNQIKIATSVSEIVRNVVIFAEKGKIRIKQTKKGIEISVTDKGPGIKDLNLAMKDGHSSIKSLGIGLPGTKRVMDCFDITTEIGKGTKVVMGKNF